MGLLPGGPAFWMSTVALAWWFDGGVSWRRHAAAWSAFCLAAVVCVLLFLWRTYVSVSLWKQAVSLYKAGDYTTAEPLLARAADMCPTAFGTCRIYAAILNDWAAACERMGKHEKAEPLYLEALEVLREILGDRHRDYALSLRNLAAMYESLGRYDQAEPLHLEAVGVWKALLGDRHPNYATSLSSLAECVRAKSLIETSTPEGRQRAAAQHDAAWRALSGSVAGQLLSRGAAQGSAGVLGSSTPAEPDAAPATAGSDETPAPAADEAAAEETPARGDANAPVAEEENVEQHPTPEPADGNVEVEDVHSHAEDAAEGTAVGGPGVEGLEGPQTEEDAERDLAMAVAASMELANLQSSQAAGADIADPSAEGPLAAAVDVTAPVVGVAEPQATQSNEGFTSPTMGAVESVARADETPFPCEGPQGVGADGVTSAESSAQGAGIDHEVAERSPVQIDTSERPSPAGASELACQTVEPLVAHEGAEDSAASADTGTVLSPAVGVLDPVATADTEGLLPQAGAEDGEELLSRGSVTASAEAHGAHSVHVVSSQSIADGDIAFAEGS